MLYVKGNSKMDSKIDAPDHISMHYVYWNKICLIAQLQITYIAISLPGHKNRIQHLHVECFHLRTYNKNVRPVLDSNEQLKVGVKYRLLSLKLVWMCKILFVVFIIVWQISIWRCLQCE